jgi:hypothetical protein
MALSIEALVGILALVVAVITMGLSLFKNWGCWKTNYAVNSEVDVPNFERYTADPCVEGTPSDDYILPVWRQQYPYVPAAAVQTSGQTDLESADEHGMPSDTLLGISLQPCTTLY